MWWPHQTNHDTESTQRVVAVMLVGDLAKTCTANLNLLWAMVRRQAVFLKSVAIWTWQKLLFFDQPEMLNHSIFLNILLFHTIKHIQSHRIFPMTKCLLLKTSLDKEKIGFQLSNVFSAEISSPCQKNLSICFLMLWGKDLKRQESPPK